MQVTKLFIKQQHGIPAKECLALNLQRGCGILGDINAVPGNPRQVLIASNSTLVEFGLKPGDLGENILIDAEIEHFSSGMVLQVGISALIRLSFLCEPCAYLEKIQPGLAKLIKGKRGFLGIVVRDGEIVLEDNILVTPYRLKPIPNQAKGRFREFVQRIPSGKVVKTTELLFAMGVTKAYSRAIPTFLKKADPSLPIHRIVRADGRLLSQYIAEQEQSLVKEGIEIKLDRIANPNFYWESSQFHELGNF